MAKEPKLKLKSWYSNKYQLVVVQRNVLSFFTIFAMVAVLVSVVFVRQIMNSKSLVPYVVELEETTGIPTVVQQLNTSSFTADDILKRYFLNSFVMSLEGYNSATYASDYRKVRLMSTPALWRQLSARIGSRNENSPFTKISNKGMLVVRIKSISFKTPTSVIIRMRVEPRGNTPGFRTRDLIADIDFRFANLNLTTEDRFINPLGFQVTKYVVDDELVQGYEERQR